MPSLDAAIQRLITADFRHFEFINEFIPLNLPLGGGLNEVREGAIISLRKTPEEPIGVFTETKRDCFGHGYLREYVVFILSPSEYTG